MKIALQSHEATRAFGRIFASLLAEHPRPLPVFFYGEMGTGKTTLISAMVKNLPGGDGAETSSPSFTLSNMYATRPPVAHFDLYRQENGSADESLLDFLDGERHLVLVEWAERLPGHALPPERLACEMTAMPNGRRARLTAFGREAEALLQRLDALTADGRMLNSQRAFSRGNP